MNEKNALQKNEKPTILVVDDNEPGRYATARDLRQAGFAVTEAATGEEALNRAADNPALIVLDINLPDISGFEVCRKVKENPATAHIPVVHLSAKHLDNGAKVKGLNIGADAYLTQPVNPQLLVATINALLRMKQAEEMLSRVARQWQVTFDAVKDAIWVLDADQRVLRSNRGAEDLFQRPADAMLGRYCWEIVHGTTEPIPNCPIVRMRQSLHREIMVLPVGERWFEATVYPLLEAGNRLTGAVHIVSDITERKQAEDKMAEQLHELQRWHNVMLGREDRVIELKREVNELLARDGQPARYPSAVEIREKQT